MQTLKHKKRDYVTEVRSASARLWWVLLQQLMLRLFFIVECGIACFLCAMRVFEIRASPSSPNLPLCKILFLLQPLLS